MREYYYVIFRFIMLIQEYNGIPNSTKNTNQRIMNRSSRGVMERYERNI